MEPERPGRRRVRAALLAVLLVAACAGAGVGVARSGLVSGRLPWSNGPQACRTTSVAVVIAPEIAPVVERALKPLAGRALPGGSCLAVTLNTQPPAATVAAAATADTSPPQVWVPDSSLWASQASDWPLQPAGSLATSPVVVASTATGVRQLGWSGRDVTWAQALDPGHQLVSPPMTDDAPALLGLLALARTLGPGTATEQRIVATVLRTAQASADDRTDAVDTTRGAKAPAVLLASRQVVEQANRGAAAAKGKDAPPRLVAVQPTGLPAQLDYPVLRVGRPTDDPVAAAGADLVVQALLAPATRTAAASLGFGPPSTTRAPTTDAGREAVAAAEARTSAFVAQVRAVALPSRLLTVMDVSLSMRKPIRPGLSRARLAAQAAIDAGTLLPDGSSVGVWSFAGRPVGRLPYRRVTPIGLLGAPDRLAGADVQHRDVVNRALADLPRQLTSGGTALYDTALAAMREVRASYDPRANNAVVLFTDGGNDYDKGLSFSKFRAAVAADAARNPQQSVLLVAVGIGPEADMEALEAMCKAAGGRAYRATSRGDLRTVLFDAIAHRPAAVR